MGLPCGHQHTGKALSPLIGRLAQDWSFPGLGGVLLADAVTRCARQSDEIGAALIVVEAKNKQAKHFYEKHGFTPLEVFPSRLVLAMRMVASGLSGQ